MMLLKTILHFLYFRFWLINMITRSKIAKLFISYFIDKEKQQNLTF